MEYNKSLLDMSYKEAREFFLSPKSYFSGNLPSYFNFKTILLKAENILRQKSLSEILVEGRTLNNESDINYKIMFNKDGKYAWRQLQIIHPILYVDLVNLITEEENWELIKNKFSSNQNLFGKYIRCISIPRTPKAEGKEMRDTILNWWVNSEQALIKNALDYSCCIQTDVTDCYPSIYTPSIAWALHGKEVAKEDINKKELLGSQIDHKLQQMQGDNVCGIPQGSILMDFLAEVVLDYADSQLYELLLQNKISSNYLVFRYRDDYKILSNNSEEANKIMKLLSMSLYELNLKINSSKTLMYDDMILDGIKPDKIYWTTQYESFVGYFPNLKEYKKIVSELEKVNEDIREDEDDQIDDFFDNKFSRKPYFKISIQKHLLQIKILGEKFPNCGQLRKALTDLYKYRIYDMSVKPRDIEQLISIVVQIMLDNPTTIQHCVVILGKLLSFFAEDKSLVNEVLDKIISKFSGKVNTDIVEIWLQRIALLSEFDHNFSPKICTFSNINEFSIWNSTWIKKEFNFSDQDIFDMNEKNRISYVVPKQEIDDFSNYYPEEEE